MWFKPKSLKKHRLDHQEKLRSVLTNGVELSVNELIRYQSKTSLIHLGARKNLQSKMSGNYLARSKGRGMEFDEVRHYQNGDDIRAIDWRVTAKTGKTHTKLYREEVERPVLIATDLSPTMMFGSQLLFKSIQAAHLAALLAWHAKEKGDRVGGIIFNNEQHQELKPRSRKQGVLHYLHGLCSIHDKALKTSTENSQDTSLPHTQTFAQNCARLRQLSKPGSLVYLITDGFHLDEEAIRHLSQISRHCELVVALISDPLEHNLPVSSQRMNVAVTNSETQQQLTLGDKKFAQKYTQHMSLFKAQQERLLMNAGARVIHYCAAELLETQLKTGIASWIR